MVRLPCAKIPQSLPQVDLKKEPGQGGLVLGLVTFGITFLVALVASPVIYAVNHHANTKAIAEGMPYSNQVPSGILGAGEVIQFNTLTPLNQTPQVKMTFRNLATNEIFSVTKAVLSTIGNVAKAFGGGA